jgi:TatA/E family protein of Tat protein translocase
MFNIGPWEFMLILLVALFVVGPDKLPEVAKSLGKGLNEFKKVTSGYKKELQDAMDGRETPVKTASYQAPVDKEEEAALNIVNNFEFAVAVKGAENITANTAAAPGQDEQNL